MRNEHGWRSKTSDGARREVVARRFGGKWTVRSRVKGEDDWTVHEEPPLEDLVRLRQILFDKYQRKRVPWEDVEAVAALIRARGGEPEAFP